MINLIDPTCFTSAVYITDTTTGVNDIQDIIPPFPTTVVEGKTVPVSAAFAISSTGGGFLPPSMTTAQINALKAPTGGLTAYNSTTNTMSVYNGTTWQTLATTGGGGNAYSPGNPLYLATTEGVNPSISIYTDEDFTTITGAGNTFLGASNAAALSGNYNTLLGNAGEALTTANNNTLIGFAAGASATSSSDMAILGTNALDNSTSSMQGVFIGSHCGHDATQSISQSVYIGYQSGYTAIASETVGIGALALQNLVSGDAVATSVGFSSLQACTGGGNTALGWKAGVVLTSGTSNVFLGDSAAIVNTVGSSTVVIGHAAASNYLNYNNSIIIGASADAYVPDGGDPVDTPTLTQYLTIVGDGATAAASSTVIGAGAIAQGTNAIAIGDSTAAAYCNYGIAIGSGATAGTANPAIQYSISIGQTSSTQGNASIAIGASATVEGGASDSSIALGANASVTASNSVAIGHEAQATVNQCINLGYGHVVGINQPAPQFALDIANVNATVNGNPLDVTGIKLNFTTTTDLTQLGALVPQGSGAFFLQGSFNNDNPSIIYIINIDGTPQYFNITSAALNP
ncbi:MAG TPA: hypothetical protein VHA52_09960 [Candidatus Babeliaceae bacterium]|nr:hypothetical protein [Candidatus Babeliaceae bacterium]